MNVDFFVGENVGWQQSNSCNHHVINVIDQFWMHLLRHFFLKFIAKSMFYKIYSGLWYHCCYHFICAVKRSCLGLLQPVSKAKVLSLFFIVHAFGDETFVKKPFKVS